jgi:hypothetical protein
MRNRSIPVIFGSPLVYIAHTEDIHTVALTVKTASSIYLSGRMEGSVVGMVIGHTNKRGERRIWEKGMDIKI